ncbi:MAG TPA: hypothetical protein VLA97_03540 [Nocardioidaceae bacterium]|nr:hypothetical protein [Nocardioidaceae bacterium]
MSRTLEHARPALPSVNVLSPWVFDQMATRRLRRRFLAGGLALLLVVGAGWSVQHLRVRQAEQLLAVEQAETARLTAETQELAPVRAFVTGVDAQKALVQKTMEQEIYFSRVLESLQDATPDDARVESLAVTIAPQAGTTDGADAADSAATAATAAVTASACPGPDPFQTKVVVGCITLAGTADSRADVGDFVIRLGDDELFVEPFISTTTTADADRVTFSGSVGLSKRVFSKRFADLDKLLEKRSR